MTEVNGVQKKNICCDGKFYEYTVSKDKPKDADNYVQMKLSDGSLWWVLKEEGKEVDLKTKKGKQTTGFIDAYDNGVDKVFDTLDALMGTDNNNLTSDGDNDGKISWWEKAKRAIKGAIITPLKGMIKHPIITAASIAGIAAATSAAATVGIALSPILLGIGALVGIGTLIYGGCKAYNAKTDSEARAAWENIGSGLATTVLSTKGLFKLLPKDNSGIVRTGVDNLWDKICRIRFNKFTPSNDNIISKALYRTRQFKRATLGITVKPNDYNTTIQNARGFANAGKWESLGLEIQKLKRIAKLVDDTNIKTTIQNALDGNNGLVGAYESGMAATTPVKTLLWTGNSNLCNWTDYSSTELQKLTDNALRFAN